MALPILLLSTNCVGFPEHESRVSNSAFGLLLTEKVLNVESEQPRLLITFKDAEIVPKLLNMVDGFELLLFEEVPLLKFQFLLATVLPIGTADISKNEIFAP